MTTSEPSEESRLNDILKQIDICFTDFKLVSSKKSFQVKTQSYFKLRELLGEAIRLLSILQSKIDSLGELPKGDSHSTEQSLYRINSYIDILENLNPTFDQTLNIYSNLVGIKSSIQTTSCIREKIDEDVVVEELED